MYLELRVKIIRTPAAVRTRFRKLEKRDRAAQRIVMSDTDSSGRLADPDAGPT